jgi:hypothetical protein
MILFSYFLKQVIIYILPPNDSFMVIMIYTNDKQKRIKTTTVVKH